jgi:hypothetical protein
VETRTPGTAPFLRIQQPPQIHHLHHHTLDRYDVKMPTTRRLHLIDDQTKHHVRRMSEENNFFQKQQWTPPNQPSVSKLQESTPAYSSTTTSRNILSGSRGRRITLPMLSVGIFISAMAN